MRTENYAVSKGPYGRIFLFSLSLKVLSQVYLRALSLSLQSFRSIKTLGRSQMQHVIHKHILDYLKKKSYKKHSWDN